jgi:hypothetical protein
MTTKERATVETILTWRSQPMQPWHRGLSHMGACRLALRFSRRFRRWENAVNAAPDEWLTWVFYKIMHRVVGDPVGFTGNVGTMTRERYIERARGVAWVWYMLTLRQKRQIIRLMGLGLVLEKLDVDAQAQRTGLVA